MKMIHLLISGVTLLWALPLMAFLPPDAPFRKNEIVQQRVRARAEYEQQQADYQKAKIASRVRIAAAMKKPPWMRAGKTEVKGATSEISLETERAPQINHRFLVSGMLLILLGAVAGWVRHATRETDE
ncbi:MAG: hypothetical protein HOO88_08255 [Kiritimatiellaceae bacterium]|nr:hypothetical protein [Kiritimatiellaceae bacterium]